MSLTTKILKNCKTIFVWQSYHFSANNIGRKWWNFPKVANSFSNFFENAVNSLGIKTNEYLNNNYGLKNPVESLN